MVTCHLRLLVTTATTSEWSLMNTISGPQRGLLSETEVGLGSSCGTPKGWGSRFLTLFSLSQQGRFFLVGDFPLGDKQCQPRGWDDAGKIKPFFPFFVCYSQVLFFGGFFVVAIVSLCC